MEEAANGIQWVLDQIDLVAAGYGEYWPYGVSWNEVKSDDFTNDDIERLNQTAEQRNKNRRVKIIFAKN